MTLINVWPFAILYICNIQSLIKRRIVNKITFNLETRKTDLLERQVISEESKTKSDIGVQEGRLELDFGKFENLK